MSRATSVSEQYLPLFCHELYQLYRAGITPAEGLQLLREEERDPKVLSWLDGLCSATEMGTPLGQALRESGVFPDYFSDMIGLAEQTGRMEDVLLALQRHYDRKNRMRSDIRNAATVPAVLLVVMLAVVILLITQVLPVFDRVLAQLGVRMGGVAAGMMQLGAAISKAGAWIGAVLGVIALAVLVVALVPSLRKRFTAAFNRRFGGRGLLGQMAVSRFASSMSMATASGMTMDEAVELSARLCAGSKEIDEKTAKCRELIETGSTPADALSESGLFSGRDSRLLKLAERTGSLSETLEQLAARQEEESLRRIDRLVGSIEPGIVLVTSVLAGVILLSVMLPMMGLLSGIG